MIDMSDSVQGAGWTSKGAVAAALASLAVTGAYRWVATSPPTDALGCPAAGPVAVELLAIDTTDPLVAANPARASTAVDDLLQRLPGGALLVVTGIGGDVTAEMKPAFIRCGPQRVEDANLATPPNPLKRARRSFEAEVRASVGKVSAQAAAHRSPLVEQLSKIVTDARIQNYLSQSHPSTSRELTMVGDLLQASASGNAYKGPLHLPEKPPRVLEGWNVRFIQTTNPRDAALQTAAVRAEWRRWALAAGAASVTFEGTGFAKAVS